MENPLRDSSSNIGFTVPLWPNDTEMQTAQKTAIGRMTRDTMQTVETSKAPLIKGQYTTKSDRPSLPEPLAGSDPMGLTAVVNFFKNSSEMIKSFTLPDQPQEKFAGLINKKLENLSDEQIALIGDGKSPKEVREMVRFAVLHPAADFPKSLKELAAQLRSQAETESGTLMSSEMTAFSDIAAKTGEEAIFRGLLISSNLSTKEQNQVLFAHYFPETAASLTDNLQSVLKQANAQASSEAKQAFGLPDNWNAEPDKSAFEERMNDAYAGQLGKALSKELSEGRISLSQYNELRSLAYIPNAKTPNEETLKPLLQKIIGSTLNSLKEDWGFPDNQPPQLNKGDFETILSGAFLESFNVQLKNASPPLNSEQEAQLLEALSSPEARKLLSPELQSTLEDLENIAIATVRDRYGLPESWTPPAALLAQAANLDPAIKFDLKTKQAAFDQASEVAETGQKLLEQFENDPSKAIPNEFALTYRDFLRLVGEALIHLQEIIFAMAIGDAKIAKKLSQIDHDSAIGKLKKQQEQMEEVKEKLAKLGMKNGMSIATLMAVGFATILVFGIGFALISLAISMLALSAQKHGGNVKLDSIFKDFVESMSKALNISKGTAAAMMILLGGMAILADLLMMGGNLLSQLLQAGGVPKEVAERVAMVLSMVLMAAVLVFTMIMTGGATAELLAMEVAKAMEASAAGLIPAIVQMTINMARILGSAVLEAIISAIKDAVDVMRSALNILQKAAIGTKRAEAMLAIQTQLTEASATLAKATNISEIENAITSALQKVADFLGRALRGATSQEGSAGILPKMSKAKELVQKAEVSAQRAKEALDEARTILQTAQDGVGDVQELTKNVLKLEEKASQAMDDVANAKKNLESVSQLAIEEANEFQSAVAQFEVIFGILTTVPQAVVTIQNNIVRSQIAIIKAAFEADAMVTEQFIKLLKALIGILQDMVQGFTDWGKNVGSQQMKFYKDLTNMLSNLVATA